MRKQAGERTNERAAHTQTEAQQDKHTQLKLTQKENAISFRSCDSFASFFFFFFFFLHCCRLFTNNL